MFLTNNYRTMNNLMIYSGGEYIPRIIIKLKIHEGNMFKVWTKDFQNYWNKHINNNIDVAFINSSFRPYGNIKKQKRLQVNKNNKLYCEDF